MPSPKTNVSLTSQAAGVFLADIPASPASSRSTDNSSRPSTTERIYNKLYVEGDEEYIERGFNLIGDHTCRPATQWITVELCDGHGPLPFPQARNFMNLKESQQKEGTSGWKLIQRRERMIGASVTVVFHRKADFPGGWRISWYAS